MKASEKRLLCIFAGLLGLGLVALLADLYFDKRDVLLAERTALENDWIRIETLLEERKTWEVRTYWLDANQPAFTSTEAIDQAIFDEVLNLGANGVSTSNQALLPTLQADHYVQAGVSVDAEGSIGDLVRWLHELGESGRFHVIRDLRIAPSPDDPETISAKFKLLRWYAPAKS